MPKVTYIEYNGKEHEVEVEKGLSIMRVQFKMEYQG